jgi:hypothetical protein
MKMPAPREPKALLIATIYSRLSVIQAALAEAGWQVHAFQRPKEALESLKGHGYQAVFCDEDLKGASAVGFLAWTRRISSELPFYLIAAGREPLHFRPSVTQPTEVISFPPVPETLPLPAGPGTLTPPPQALPQTPLSGNTSLVPLTDLLEMMGVAAQSAIVVLDSSGSVFVEDGKLVHAEAARLVGLKALARLIALECDFRVRPYRRPERATIGLPVATAMTEAARMADEQQRYAELMAAVRRQCPAVTDMAAGYLRGAFSQGCGEAAALFELAQKLLAHSPPGIGRITELSLASESSALALSLFGDDNLLAAKAPAEFRTRLYAAVQSAVAVAVKEQP